MSTPVPNAVPTLRRLANASALFLCGFLFVRTVCLEPFGVPTGSMAGTLVGNHREAFCPRCDTRVVVGEPGADSRPVRFDACPCPNCGHLTDLRQAREIPGDRLLVDKTVFAARPPRRWEVAVFRCPADGDKPYVKRVVGLPGELVQISGGDVYADGQLLRKSLNQVRETRAAVFDGSHAPPGGWGPRWQVQPLGKSPTTAAAEPAAVDDAGLVLDGTAGAGVAATYRHRNLDTGADEPVPDFLAYNGPPDRRGFARGSAATAGDPVHDFTVAFTLEVRSGTGRVAVRLSDGGDSVRAELPVGGPAADLAGVTVAADKQPLAATAAGLVLEPGKSYRVEFAFVDRRASLAVDGREVVPALDLPADPAGAPRRGGMARPVQIGAAGVVVAVRDFVLYRDVHYVAANSAGAGWRLGPAEYFVLGDNTQNSHDSRAWATADGKPAPGVPAGAFLGKPFLIHQPLRLTRLPAGGAVPTPDWSRLRFLR